MNILEIKQKNITWTWTSVTKADLHIPCFQVWVFYDDKWSTSSISVLVTLEDFDIEYGRYILKYSRCILKRLLNSDMMICVFPVPNMKFHIPEYPKLHFANINTNMHFAPIFTRSSLDFWISWCLIKCLFDFDKLIARQFSEYSSNVQNKILKMKYKVESDGLFERNWNFLKNHTLKRMNLRTL